ncbi:MAG: ABC transporter substrate-binding protein [Methylocapsa sp.]|nr:ABC transporter substrate-binding protein [Methylocapsa sp.]
MSEVIALSPSHKGAKPGLRIGLLRLTDGAPVIIAQEFGFFAEEGLEVELSVEPSWANIADKLAFGFLDAAVIVPPLAFAIQLGLRGRAESLFISYAISAGGNTVTLARLLADRVKDLALRQNLRPVGALALCLREQRVTLGVVHAYSTHNLLLRYWLAAAGIEAGRDFVIAVVPPASAVEALGSGQIAGFCAGAPWGEAARRMGAGENIAASRDVWRHAPEKAFALRARWAETHSGAAAGALRALLRAAKFCDDPQNSSYIAAVLSRRKYLDVDSHTILAGLPGGPNPGTSCTFYRGAATFPWRSHALWFLREMQRWHLIDEAIDLTEQARLVYRPDLYRAALAPLGEPVPVLDSKPEGAHDKAWMVEAVPEEIAMPPDSFCDGAVFGPEALSAAVQPNLIALHNL